MTGSSNAALHTPARRCCPSVDGAVRFKDRHATAFDRPSIDAQQVRPALRPRLQPGPLRSPVLHPAEFPFQDYTLLLAEERGGQTRYVVRRKLHTCDDEVGAREEGRKEKERIRKNKAGVVTATAHATSAPGPHSPNKGLGHLSGHDARAVRLRR